MYLMQTTHVRLMCLIHTYNNCNSSISGRGASSTPPFTAALLYFADIQAESKVAMKPEPRRTPDPGCMAEPV